MTALRYPAVPLTLVPANNNGCEPIILLRPANEWAVPDEAA